ncbi:IS66 family transposase zinc-finger binding domain-containing protein [Streptomyces sp. NPDC051664]|uniref:IS66 family transposase zinc-finger binding domain-containing protein n=1 Tax=Streptomyces sp. NPDC051664 TaxID=3365668 RepID=UPI0037AC99EA
MPPSSDTFGRPEKKPQVKSGRKRGRQPGADGSGLTMVEKPDVTEDHVPAACTGCGEMLGKGDSVGFERRQVRDIPLATVKVTEHRAHRCRCACGTVTAEPMPEEIAGSPSSYGPSLRALAVAVHSHESPGRRGDDQDHPPTTRSFVVPVPGTAFSLWTPDVAHSPSARPHPLRGRASAAVPAPSPTTNRHAPLRSNQRFSTRSCCEFSEPTVACAPLFRLDGWVGPLPDP